MFSLESPQRGDSNEYTQYTIFQYKKENIFFIMKVYCVFSLESPQRGDSNEYTQYTIFQYKKENIPNLSQICNYWICSKGLKNEFETAVVNEPSVSEPLKFYCNLLIIYTMYSY